ncbi:MAG: thiamine pyrophosphate-dependent enzyme, partial [Methyloligellaceae bacterium]
FKDSIVEGMNGAMPMDPSWLMLQIAETLPSHGIVVNEGLTAAWRLTDLLPYRDRYSYHGLASGGIGWGIAGAVGVQLAQPERPVCAVIGDGSAMYSIQALWTAAHLKLPMTFVICNNLSYRILKQRLLAFHKNDNYIAMDFQDPPLDFVSIAQGLGVTAERITEPDAVRPALEAALANGGPNLLDVVIDGSVGG